MKKFYSLLIMAIVSLAAFAQNNPNRVIVHETSGNISGYLAERIDSISFAKLEGRVAADAVFNAFASGTESDTLWVAITRTPQCVGFKLACLSANVLSHLPTEAALASYIDEVGENVYYKDYTDAQLTGMDLSDDTDYVFATVGYDQYGIACSVSKAEFHTPRPAVIGNPAVACTVDDVTANTITFSFKPNADAAGYAFCIYPKGEAEQQLAQWGPRFGFNNIGEMVRGWGIKAEGDYVYTYTGMTPGTEYELYIQPWDVNGNNADYSVVPVTTSKLGGEGVAEVSIEIGSFGGEATSGYYQVVIYTPNDQASLHRDMLIEKDAIDSGKWTEEEVQNYLKEDDPNYNPDWNQYGVDEAWWNAEPNKAYIAYAIAQNINGEWGPLAKKEFTTPDAPAGKAPAVKAVPSRIKHGTSRINTAMPFKATPKAPSKMQLLQLK